MFRDVRPRQMIYLPFSSAPVRDGIRKTVSLSTIRGLLSMGSRSVCDQASIRTSRRPDSSRAVMRLGSFRSPVRLRYQR
jgi:hypothetical protein